MGGRPHTAIRRLAWACSVATIVMSVFLGVSYALVQARIWQPNLLLAGGGVQGVDLSEHQGEVDFDALGDARIEFAYLKATEGSSHIDSQFARSWSEAATHGIPVGAYHFFSYDTPGEQQARHFLSVVGDMGGRLVPAVDVEWYGDKADNPPSEEDMHRELHAFLDAVEAGCGRKPIIYARSDIYRNYHFAEEFGEHGVWAVSAYLPVGVEWRIPWMVWQYSIRGQIAGIGNDEGHVDLDVLADGMTVEDLMM